jgi:hypothetical protein
VSALDTSKILLQETITIMKKVATLAAGLALAALAAGCTETTTNSNANGNTVATNTAVMTNNNGNANTAGVVTTNANANANAARTYNANITRQEYERDKERYAREAKESGSTVGSGLEDGWLWTKTRAELMTTADLRDSTINVDVNNSVITLRGTVANAAQKAKAESVAKGISGQKGVHNELRIAPNDSITNTNSNANNANTHNANANANMRNGNRP